MSYCEKAYHEDAYVWYCIVGKFGGIKVWQIYSFQVSDKIIDHPKDY